MTFYDARSSDSSDPPLTPEQRVRVRRPNPDDDDLRSLGSYTRPKPIPKEDKLVEEMKLHHQFEVKSLRTEMERMNAEQRRLKDDVNSVRTQSSTSKPSRDNFRSEKRVTRRAIPAEIFYGLPPRHTSLHPDPMTLSDLRTPTPVDTTGLDEFRRNSATRVATHSTRERPHVSHSTTPVL